MKYLILAFSLLIFSGSSAFAQLYYTKGESRYIYADKANIRKALQMNSEVVDKLSAGQEITIEEEGPVDTIDGNDGFWLLISYKKNSEPNKGYIWSHNLSHVQLRRGNVKFVYGIEKRLKNTEDGNDLIFNIKAIRNDSIVSRKIFAINSESKNYIAGKIIQTESLSGVEYIIQLTFSGEACGIGSYNFHYAWNGNKMLELPSTFSVSDAGVYYHGEYMVFPNENQLIQNLILKVVADGHYPEEDPEAADMIIKHKTTYYQWDGNKAVEQKTEE